MGADSHAELHLDHLKSPGFDFKQVGECHRVYRLVCVLFYACGVMHWSLDEACEFVQSLEDHKGDLTVNCCQELERSRIGRLRAVFEKAWERIGFECAENVKLTFPVDAA